jgi:hypothetical protein
MIEIIGLIWLAVIVVCIIEAYFSTVYIDEPSKNKKNKKNEYKSTN